jgi:hypothetical protein
MYHFHVCVYIAWCVCVCVACTTDSAAKILVALLVQKYKC